MRSRSLELLPVSSDRRKSVLIGFGWLHFPMEQISSLADCFASVGNYQWEKWTQSDPAGEHCCRTEK
jgi:hypothetical protein